MTLALARRSIGSPVFFGIETVHVTAVQDGFVAVQNSANDLPVGDEYLVTAAMLSI